ncbi:MAG: hypothetical protein Q7K25_11005 [Actinomycetota bacterium]|nr:hypothetical protein [Actinomycetota bacterium]
MSEAPSEPDRQTRVANLRSGLTQHGATLHRQESFDSVPRGVEIWLLTDGQTVQIPKPYLLDPPSAVDEELFYATLTHAEQVLAQLGRSS